MTKILIYFNLCLTLLIGGMFVWFLINPAYFLDNKNSQSPSQLNFSVSEDNTKTGAISAEATDNCGEKCIEQINQAVVKALANSQGQLTTTKTPTPAAIPQTQRQQVSYIPISGPITTTSSSWIDAPGTDFYMDLEGDYDRNATVTWEGYLKVAHSNGTAYARLYDATHGIAVNGSEISLSNTSTLTRVSSGNLSIWSGKNLYKVQLKSLNTFEVTFGSGKVKVSY